MTRKLVAIDRKMVHKPRAGKRVLPKAYRGFVPAVIFAKNRLNGDFPPEHLLSLFSVVMHGAEPWAALDQTELAELREYLEENGLVDYTKKTKEQNGSKKRSKAARSARR